MGVVIGDPLYRPYATWRTVATSPAGDAWRSYREIVLKAGNVLQAAAALQQAGQQTGNSLFDEALGSARMDAKDWAGAIASFDEARKLTTDPAVSVRLDLETIVSLQALGKKTEAGVLAQSVSSGLPPGPRKELFSQFAIGPVPTPTVEPIALSSGPVPGASPSVTLPAATPPGTPDPTPTPEPPPPPPPPIPELRP
jgi:hypothetical protein